MTREENDRLLRLAKDGDSEATERLIEGNMGLCRSIAMRFRDRGAELDDLVQLASIGMLKAVRSFDFSYNTAFSTYAVPLIIGEIRRFLRDDGAVRVGRSTKKLSVDAMRRREEFVKKHGREPKTVELAELCGVSTDELVFALGAANPIKSLSDPVGDDDGISFGELISDPDDGIGRMTDRIALSEAVKSLPPVQRKLIYLRYCRDMSQSETGKILGMTQVRVSREEKKIMEALKKVL